ncbi:permease-like cell division protein FtsX [Sedimenticola selenatireducens]|uniref:Cell division protein FtsX n=1 Tax=Sedimenticola selenatireducens TaxID=191960 RepID=A0A2N6CX58_9GAMM|nr:permease-like cell division protein FtsX [Sedimenticola selenatireducens]PLX61873.1 MAG: cell division protein FtsX [Sedimenticola selenatireducens]
MRRSRKKQSARISPRSSLRMDVWLMRHLQVALASLGRLIRTPLSSLMTTLVIGIALALPAGLYLLLGNVQTLSGNWDGAASISLFLKQETSDKQARQLASRLQNDPAINQVKLISRTEALEEFRQLSGFAGVLDSLDENPLPSLLIVEPTAQHAEPVPAEALLARLRQNSEVEFAQLDLQWVRRFHAITRIAQRGVIILASLLGLSVLLIVGNTIRLEIQNRHAEIEITKLIGGTNAFIRRPFLYNGAWYGLFGGISAWLMVTVSLLLLDNPIEQLAGLYQSGFQLSGIGFSTLLMLLGGSTLLGLAGSWIAVGRHLNEIEPS